MQESPFGPKPYLDPKESARVRANRAQAFADGVLSAIRGAVKSVTTDLPGLVLDAVDKISGDTKSFGEKDRSEQMFSAVTGTSKKNDQAELVGSFVNPITAVKSIILPAALIRSAKDVREATRAIDAGALEWEQMFRLPPNIDDGILRTVLDSRNAAPTIINPGTRTLEQAWDFPELYKVMPRIGKTPVTFDPSVQGAFMQPWDNNAITIGTYAGKTPAELLAHETQHVIQTIFNMNPGASTEMFLTEPKALPGVISRARELYNLAAETGYYDEAKELLDYRKLLQEIDQSAGSKYLRTAGEVEARAAEKIITAPTGPLKSGLSYYSPDASMLIKNPRTESKADAKLDWDKFLDRLISLQDRLEGQ